MTRDRTTWKNLIVVIMVSLPDGRERTRTYQTKISIFYNRSPNFSD